MSLQKQNKTCLKYQIYKDQKYYKNKKGSRKMASLFEKGFNKFADIGNALNKGANKIVGKEVFGEIRKFEEPREFKPYDSFPAYSVPEPEQWKPLTGTAKEFTLDGNVISVSANLDTCMQYVDLFKSAAKYYADRFEFKYHQCVEDYDTLLHYFEDMYFEGLSAMIDRAYSLLLPFGVFNVNMQTFRSYQVNTYNRALNSYTTMFKIKEIKNQAANNLGDTVGSSVKMQGGGFGFKGAMKGVAQAEAFNLGMEVLGKYVTNQTRMSPEEKAKVFSKFSADIFFKEVYSDYVNTFYTTIQILADNGMLGRISTRTGEEFNTTINNLKNPMFPQDKIAPTLAKLISSYPFTTACYEVVKLRYGNTDEVKQLIEYFTI